MEDMSKGGLIEDVMKQTADTALDVADGAVDFLDKISTPTSRSGHSVERVGKLRQSGVSERVIALQMSETSPNNHLYTEEMVRGLAMLWDDCHTKAVPTKKASRGLMRDQETAKKKNQS